MKEQSIKQYQYSTKHGINLKPDLGVNKGKFNVRNTLSFDRNKKGYVIDSKFIKKKIDIEKLVQSQYDGTVYAALMKYGNDDVRIRKIILQNEAIIEGKKEADKQLVDMYGKKITDMKEIQENRKLAQERLEQYKKLKQEGFKEKEKVNQQVSQQSTPTPTPTEGVKEGVKK